MSDKLSTQETIKESHDVVFNQGHTALLIAAGLCDEKHLRRETETSAPTAVVPVEYFLQLPLLKENSLIKVPESLDSKHEIPAQEALFKILTQETAPKNPLSSAQSLLDDIDGPRFRGKDPSKIEDHINRSFDRWELYAADDHNKAIPVQDLLRKLDGPPYESRLSTEANINTILMKKEDGKVISIDEKKGMLEDLRRKTIAKFESSGS